MATVCGKELLKYNLIENIPPSVYYIPDFVTEEEEEKLLHQVYSAPKPKWTQLSNRRLQNWGGLPHPKGMIAEPLPQWLQEYAKKIADLGAFEDKVPNHVLVNEYLAGQGIMPHEDGPLFYPVVSTISLGSHTLLDFYQPLHHTDHEASEPQTGQAVEMLSEKYTEKEEGGLKSMEGRFLASVLLEPRSLVFVCDDMYKLRLHGISERSEDLISNKVVNLDKCKANLGDTLERKTRVSLTIRYVPKVLKNKILFGKKR